MEYKIGILARNNSIDLHCKSIDLGSYQGVLKKGSTRTKTMLIPLSNRRFCKKFRKKSRINALTSLVKSHIDFRKRWFQEKYLKNVQLKLDFQFGCNENVSQPNINLSMYSFSGFRWGKQTRMILKFTWITSPFNSFITDRHHERVHSHECFWIYVSHHNVYFFSHLETFNLRDRHQISLMISSK